MWLTLVICAKYVDDANFSKVYNWCREKYGIVIVETVVSEHIMSPWVTGKQNKDKTRQDKTRHKTRFFFLHKLNLYRDL